MKVHQIFPLRTKSTHWLLLALVALLFLPACKDDKIFKDGPEEYESQVAYDYIDLQLKLTQQTAGYTPPVAARAFGYTGLGLYEALHHGMEGYTSMEGQVQGLAIGALPTAENKKKHHWGEVANAVLADMLRGFYSTASPANLATIDSLENAYKTVFADEVSDKEFELSEKLGKDVAAGIIAYANTDGQAEGYSTNYPTTYTPPVGPGLWRPTPPAFRSALQPYWGNVRTFLASSVSGSTLPVPAPAFNDTDTASAFYNEMEEVYYTVNGLTTEQRTIAKYWSDDPGATCTPPGHSVSIMKYVLIQEGAKLGTTAEAYARMGMAVHDAFVSCWKAKFIYNYIRPISAIQDILDSNWVSILTTPPFPEYPSGHSVQSGAACAVLTAMFGPNYQFTDRTHESRSDIDGTPRTFASFEAFAGEAAESRLYGGIHFRSAIANGLGQGVTIGNNVMSLTFH
jgi:hypothetical protein